MPLGVYERKTIPAEIRFWKYVNKDGPIPETRPSLGQCWVWTGATYGNRYGSFTARTGNTLPAHRWSYDYANETGCVGFQVDHLCRNHSCVRPEHLEKVTAEENMRRTRKTHCIRGHALSGDNLIFRSNGWRECRTCHNTTQRKSRRRVSKLLWNKKEEKASA
jgi:hypothetical protein